MSTAEQGPWPMIEPTDTTRDIVVKMSQGNPGALGVVMRLITETVDDVPGLIDVLHMDDMGMRGPAIWVGYKDHCLEELRWFREAVRTRDTYMLATIRAAGYNVAPHGKSFR